MNQKPSERIEQHFNKILKEHPKAVDLIHEDKHHQWKVEVAAIKEYLDEEWERNNEEHEKNKTPEQRQWDVLSSNL